MKLLISGASGSLGHKLVPLLARRHEVRTIDETPPSKAPPGSTDHQQGDLRDRAVADRAVAACDAIVHLAPIAPPTDATPTEQLDRASRGTYNLLQAAIAAGVRRVILASTLRLFEQYPAEWWTVESWAPRPTTQVEDLGPYLAELTCREIARVSPLAVICLRLGEVVDENEATTRSYDPRWVHLADVDQAFERALQVEWPEWPIHGWRVYHITAAGSRTRFPLGAAAQEPFSYQPVHDFRDRWPTAKSSAPAASTGERSAGSPARRAQTPRRVVVYGAGGPLAAATTEVLARDRVLRLTDIRPIAAIAAEGKPQSPGAPLPRVLGAPHEDRVVDVADLAQVVAAAEGMDAIINCTVVRHDPVQAFRVNVLGAYHVMQAAVTHGIRRVVHTGPQQVTAGAGAPFNYDYDFGVVDDVPARPGGHLYILSKFLGQEICRIFAEEHDLEVPTLLFTNFINPENATVRPIGLNPMTVSWGDAAEALRCALDVDTLPSPFEIFHILTDLPHGKYPNTKAKRLLAWEPRDHLEQYWRRPDFTITT